MTNRPFAHRGLHGPDASENGMAAFNAAIDAGYGIECDVRASHDGVPFVFHDADLRRMSGRAEAIATLNADALDDVRLPDGGAVPRLAALLALCGDRTPLLIEIKAEGPHVRTPCRAVADALTGREAAPVAIMSFNPHVVRWFARQRNGQLRGLVITRQGKGRLRRAVEQALALWIARPDFLACDVRDLPTALSRRARARGMPVLTWTVRSAADHERAARHADQIIFEAARE
ncbi:glycerophosphodiester phosphodiesterase family protein [Sphingobium sp. CCH11-B1]|uniref:glycerophosphodiester phosphodiesterase family protein n=1 Tax=Sphingobium sp. CCH11-B1 TaxID=1768781 RepID=UPI0022B24042|nr:glycerophosphodiester phosphodiesterase family protein [Sphingobium sp. CCH11-B1]MEA3390764.1 glycerophosphodiester phosphodiesterase family protein [Pseudomonadota bacterium]